MTFILNLINSLTNFDRFTDRLTSSTLGFAFILSISMGMVALYISLINKFSLLATADFNFMFLALLSISIVVPKAINELVRFLEDTFLNVFFQNHLDQANARRRANYGAFIFCGFFLLSLFSIFSHISFLYSLSPASQIFIVASALLVVSIIGSVIGAKIGAALLAPMPVHAAPADLEEVIPESPLPLPSPSSSLQSQMDESPRSLSRNSEIEEEKEHALSESDNGDKSANSGSKSHFTFFPGGEKDQSSVTIHKKIEPRQKFFPTSIENGAIAGR